jgi:hypothetical protein
MLSSSSSSSSSSSASSSLFSKLPFDIIKEILLYDTHFVWRNDKYNKKIIVCIHRIPKDDYRFQLFDNVPKVYEIGTNNWTVILETNDHKKYVMGHYLRPSMIWEYRFVVYSKDPHTNMMCSIPDAMICIPLFTSDFGL